MEMINKEFKEGICGICPGACNVNIEFREGEIYKLRPSKIHKPSAICLRGSKAAGIVYSKDRLKTPLIRNGKKGEWHFREATWEEALDTACEGFKHVKEKYGAKALASHMGRGTFEQSSEDFLKIANPDGTRPGFFAPLGSPNNGSVGSLCYNAFGTFAPMTTFGLRGGNIAPDLENAEFIVVWGTNPIAGSPPFMYQRLKAAKEKGTPILVIDHYHSPIAKFAGESLRIKSGTDGALILSLMHIIIKEERYDYRWIKEYTYGFEELREYAKEYTPEKVSEITGISVDDIYSLARKITEADTALLTYTGLEYSKCGVQTIRGVYLLWALAGNLDIPGGLLLNTAKKEKRMKRVFYNDYEEEPIGKEEYPLFEALTGSPQFLKFPQAVLEEKPYKIAGLLNVGACMSVNYPNTEKMENALKNLEIFVTVDRFPTRDMLYADVVLPATTYFEDLSYVTYPAHARIREKIIEPIGKSRPNVFILHDIAERMGYGELYPKDEKELLEMAFKEMPEMVDKLKGHPEGVSFPAPSERQYKKYEKGLLRKDGKKGFPTKSGKIEFKSLLLEEYGYEPLPKFTSISEDQNYEETVKKYPLIFNSGARIQTTFRTQHLNIPELTNLSPLPLVLINPEDAQKRNINSGDKVILKTVRGEIPLYAKVTEDVQKGDTEINVGGGNFIQKEEWANACVNLLTCDNITDPISGFPVFKALLCEIEKV